MFSGYCFSSSFNKSIKLFNKLSDTSVFLMIIILVKPFFSITSITSLSIGVVVADSKRFANILEIGEAGAQVKHLAKTIQGSCYAINRREK